MKLSIKILNNWAISKEQTSQMNHKKRKEANLEEDVQGKIRPMKGFSLNRHPAYP